MLTRTLIPAALVLVLPACALAQGFGGLQEVVTGLNFPVALYAPPGDHTRLFVTEKGGRVRLVTVGPGPTHTLLPTPFLDLTALDAAGPFFRDALNVPLRDQGNAVVPRLVRHGGPAVPHDSQLWLPSRHDEQGFYGVAFAPDYAASGRLYVYYTQSNPNTDPGDAVPDGHIDWSYFVSGGNFCNDAGRVVIVEFTRDAADPNRVDPASERLILAIPKPFPGHNGGTIGFGSDGYLYLAIGDGGSDHDEENRALNPAVLLGKMLRIDVSGGAAADDFPADSDRNYRIPPGNPYAAGGGAPEVWARGLRNPFRWSFDRWNGDLWITDVGNSRWEEVNRVPGNGGPGRNYGWHAYEGTHATGYDTGGFDVSNLTPPVYSYPHSTAQPGGNAYQPWQVGNCVIGGHVYRGNAIRPWRGRYFFADTYFWRLWSATLDEQGQFTGLRDDTLTIVGGVPAQTLRYVTAFGQDNAGELYAVEYVAGRVRKFVPSGPQPALGDVGRQGGLPGADGLWDNNDFVVFINWFFNHDPRADMGAQGGLRAVDQRLDNNDFIVFIDAFFNRD